MLLANQKVTFRRQDGQTITAIVRVYKASRDIRVYDKAALYDWAVVWPLSLTYADGGQIMANHEVHWSELGTTSTGTTRFAPLKERPRKTFGLLAHAVSYFSEPA